VDIKWGHFHL